MTRVVGQKRRTREDFGYTGCYGKTRDSVKGPHRNPTRVEGADCRGTRGTGVGGPRGTVRVPSASR